MDSGVGFDEGHETLLRGGAREVARLVGRVVGGNKVEPGCMPPVREAGRRSQAVDKPICLFRDAVVQL